MKSATATTKTKGARPFTQ